MGLAVIINAGVLMALPLLGGAIEIAMPAAPLFDIHDIELFEIEETPSVPLPGSSIQREKTPVKPAKQPSPPKPESLPEKPRPAPSAILPDMLKSIDVDIDPDAFAPDVDLVLPGAEISGALESPGTSELEEAGPDKKIWSLDEVDRLPVKTHDTEPLYPRWALEQEVEGIVTLNLLIGTDGSVSDIRVVQSSGYRDFDRAAADAVRLWRFAPALAGDKPVTVRASQKIRFSLR
jgi:protein TonB